MRYQILIIVLTLAVALNAAGSKSKAKISIQGYMLRNEIINIAAKAKAKREADNLSATARVQQLIALKIVQAEAEGETTKAMEIMNTTKPALAVDNFPVSASSYYNHAYCNIPANFKLNTISPYSWCAGANDANQWIMIDARTPVQFKIIATQGRGGAKQWVKTFKISYSEDGNSWLPYLAGKIFNGNWDESTIRYTNVDIRAMKIRIQPMTWVGHVSMRVEVFTREADPGPVDDSSVPAIKVSNFDTARTSMNPSAGCNQWIMDGKVGAWCALDLNLNQYFQIGGGKNMIPVHWVAIATRGRAAYTQYVKTFKITYTKNGIKWSDYEGGKVFNANTEGTATVYNKIDLKALKLRIHPLTWNNHMSMKLEAYYKPIGEY